MLVNMNNLPLGAWTCATTSNLLEIGADSDKGDLGNVGIGSSGALELYKI